MWRQPETGFLYFDVTQDSSQNRKYHVEVQFSSVQSLSRVQLFATPWIAARQASLSIMSKRTYKNWPDYKSCLFESKTSLPAYQSAMQLFQPAPRGSGTRKHQPRSESQTGLHIVPPTQEIRCLVLVAATRGSQTTRKGGITKKPGWRSLMDRQPGGGRRDVFRSQSN